MQWHPTPVLLPGKSHGRRSLVGCSSWGCEGSDMTEWLHFRFSLLCIGEGNGNPLQCSCLENPRDGVAQSQTRLKWLSSSPSSYYSLISFPLSLQNESPLYTICFFKSLHFSTFNSNTTQSFFFFWKLILWEINGHKHLKIYHEKSHFHKKFLSKGIRNYKHTHPTTVISPVSVCLI